MCLYVLEATVRMSELVHVSTLYPQFTNSFLYIQLSITVVNSMNFTAQKDAEFGEGYVDLVTNEKRLIRATVKT